MSANIRMNGSPTPLTVTAGTPVTLTNFDNTGVAGWAWELLDKPESSASGVASPNSASTTTTPDLSGGSYLIRLTTYTDAARTHIDDVDQAIILVNFTIAPVDPLPAAGETREADPTLGWKARVNRFLKYVHDNLGISAGALGQSLLGTGAGAAFGIPTTSTTVTGATSYAALATDRLIVMTAAGAAAVNLNGTAPPAGFSKVLRVVNAGPSAIGIKDPGSVTIYTIPGFAGAYVDLATSNGTVWTVMYPSLANPSLFGASDTSGDLAVRGASKWDRLGLGADGTSLLAGGASGPVYGIPQEKAAVVIATGTISADARFVAYAGGADAVLTMPSTVPTSGFARVIHVVNTTSHIVTIKDPSANIIGILDGSVVLSELYATVDGTSWGPFSQFQALPYDQFSDAGLFRLAASTSVGDVVFVDNVTSSYPRITRAIASATSVLTNPLYLVLKTQDGSAAAVNVLAFVIKRGLVQGYNVAGSPAGGAAVFVTDAGILSTTAGTYKRRVGTVLSGSGASWNVWFDGTGGYGNAMPVVFGSDARGDVAVRGANNYDRLALGAAGTFLMSDGTDLVYKPNIVKRRTVSGATDTLLTTDFFVSYSNAGAVAVSLPALGAPPTGTAWLLFIQQTNAATIVTVTPATSVDGAATLVLPTGIYSAALRSEDGSIWYSR